MDMEIMLGNLHTSQKVLQRMVMTLLEWTKKVLVKVKVKEDS